MLLIRLSGWLVGWVVFMNGFWFMRSTFQIGLVFCCVLVYWRIELVAMALYLVHSRCRSVWIDGWPLYPSCGAIMESIEAERTEEVLKKNSKWIDGVNDLPSFCSIGKLLLNHRYKSNSTDLAESYAVWNIEYLDSHGGWEGVGMDKKIFQFRLRKRMAEYYLSIDHHKANRYIAPLNRRTINVMNPL